MLNRRKLTPRERRILKAVRLGLAPVLLAKRFRTTPNAMSSALARLRREGFDVPAFGGVVRAPSSEVTVHQDALKQLAAAAKRGGISTRRAARHVIVWAAKTGRLAAIITEMEGGQ